MMRNQQVLLTDGSRVLIESLAMAGGDVFIGYPITPANLLYGYGQQRFPEFFPAPDEISALQWCCGYSAVGKLPVTATSFPGFALMLESLNMAFMMELSMIIILVQRLGPSTGSATVGSQGDLLLLQGAISGGYPLPVFCPADFQDCWELGRLAVEAAIRLRTPVVLLTSKEMMMTERSLSRSTLPIFETTEHSPQIHASLNSYPFTPDLTPPFAPVGNPHYPVRLNASTHDSSGLIRNSTPEAMKNTERLRDKIVMRMNEYACFDHDVDERSRTLLVTFGISHGAVRKAVEDLRDRKIYVDRLTMKTMLPIPWSVLEMMDRYSHVFVIEENITGTLKQIIFGSRKLPHVHSIGRIGRMIAPDEICAKVVSCLNPC